MKSPHEYRYLYGLIGYPLVHSFSRIFFNSKFETEGIDAQYVNFEIENLELFPEIIAAYPNLHGLNVTAPYKEAVIPYLDSLNDDAREIGAVNVIKCIRNANSGDIIELRGYNSDVVGFGQTLDSIKFSEGTRAMVLGTGGAAKAVRTALRKRGIEVQLVSRRKSEHTLINATPVGKYPYDNKCPDFPYRFLTKEHLCYDLIYNPEETLFMKNAAKYGAATKNGLEMLLLQAFSSYEIWTS